MTTPSQFLNRNEIADRKIPKSGELKSLSKVIELRDKEWIEMMEVNQRKPLDMMLQWLKKILS